MESMPMLLMGALILGLRHGIDWDHIAAIADIVGTSTNLQCARMRSLGLATCYAIGHATVVVILGIAAISFRSILPEWIDGIMGELVGMTLLALGIWLSYSVVCAVSSKQEFHLKGRWNLFESAFKKLKTLFGMDRKVTTTPIKGYGPLGAFGVGTIHGIGAETGTQTLLIVSAVGAGKADGIMILVAFAIGLILSNTAVAAASIWGFASTTERKPVFLAMGILTAFFSIAVGSMFILGKENMLPDLQKLFA